MKQLILTFFLGLLSLQISYAQQIEINLIDISFKEQYTPTTLLVISKKTPISLNNTNLTSTLPKPEELFNMPILNKIESFHPNLPSSKNNIACEPLFDLSFLGEFLK